MKDQLRAHRCALTGPPLGFRAAVGSVPDRAILGGDIGMVLFVPEVVAYLLAAGLGRAMVRTRRAAQVDRAIDAEARRMSRSARTLQ
ncbi:MAG: hypothetical protein JNK99_06295 [Candidatus Accumulibacter sp.]|uniref:hypothetical protein n=1 Tax=Accumulibacter sp. TaxID=2053492 RepID=UPI001A3A598D|nr:hypothetical protein [Accumulibacter sp.]MBL8394353.1 hypothetical protein [Accumulibacter sp.]